MNLKELKEIVERVRSPWAVTGPYYTDFIKVATPQVILALLADREQLRFLLKAFFFSVCENGGGYVVSKDILDKARAALEKSDELEGE